MSNRGVEEIEVVCPPGQRSQAWLLCRQLLPQLETLEQSLTEPRSESEQSTPLNANGRDQSDGSLGSNQNPSQGVLNRNV